MATIYYDDSTSLSLFSGKTIGLIGYGNQGRAHALNLRDSGLNVVVGINSKSSPSLQAPKDGFSCLQIEELVKKADILSLLLPDEVLPKIFENSIAPYLSKGTALVFAHGFCVHHKTIKLPPESDIILVAPTGPGKQLRSLYQKGSGLPALIAIEQDYSKSAWETAIAYAKAIGCTRAGAIKTTFAEETITDLFCEQAVLCGGIPELIKASFDTLIAQGYQKELAYISCLKEVKLIADLLFEHGIDGMRQAISNTAKYGSAVAGPKLVNAASRQQLKYILNSIETGSFAQNFLEDSRNGNPLIKDLLRKEKISKIARTGRELRLKLHF